jgi:hypothetical protein
MSPLAWCADDAVVAATEPWVVDDLPGFEGEPCINPVPATSAAVRVADDADAGMLTFDIRGTSQQQAEAALAAAEAAASAEGGTVAGDVEVVEFDAGL